METYEQILKKVKDGELSDDGKAVKMYIDLIYLSEISAIRKSKTRDKDFLKVEDRILSHITKFDYSDLEIDDKVIRYLNNFVGVCNSSYPIQENLRLISRMKESIEDDVLNNNEFIRIDKEIEGAITTNVMKTYMIKDKEKVELRSFMKPEIQVVTDFTIDFNYEPIIETEVFEISL